MSGLLDAILSSAGGNVVDQLARQYNTNPHQTRDALSQLTQVLGKGLSNNTSTATGLGGLLEALERGNHDRYLQDPDVLGRLEARADGDAILGHIFGNKEVSRDVASRVGGNTGIDPAIIKQFLPLAAALLMGFLSKQQQAGALPSRPAAAARPGSPLTDLLDANRDGSVADDLLARFPDGRAMVLFPVKDLGPGHDRALIESLLTRGFVRLKCGEEVLDLQPGMAAHAQLAAIHRMVGIAFQLLG